MIKIKRVSKKSPKSPSKQGDYKVGNKRPPRERQFGQPNGNKRHNGAWKKEDTARYKLERMMELNKNELRAIRDNAQAPEFERKLALCILTGEWRDFKEMMDQVYGKPKESIDHTTDGEKITPVALVEFVDGASGKK